MESNSLDGYSSENERFLFAAAQIGIEVDEFRRGNVGSYLIGRCQQELDKFSAWALNNPVPDTTEYQRRHARAMGAQMAVQFITEAIAEGQSAEASLSEMDEDDGNMDGPLN